MILKTRDRFVEALIDVVLYLGMVGGCIALGAIGCLLVQDLAKVAIP